MLLVKANSETFVICIIIIIAKNSIVQNKCKIKTFARVNHILNSSVDHERNKYKNFRIYTIYTTFLGLTDFEAWPLSWLHTFLGILLQHVVCSKHINLLYCNFIHIIYSEHIITTFVLYLCTYSLF